MAHNINVLLVNAALHQHVKHLTSIHTLHAAVGMSNDHNLFDSQFQNANQKASNHTAVRMHNHAASILDNLCVSIFNAESRRKKL